MGLKKLRNEKGLTQVQLAKKSKVSYHTIKCFESGQRSLERANDEILEKLATALDVSVEKLLEEEYKANED